MIGSIHPIAEVLDELLTQYRAAGLFGEDSTGATDSRLSGDRDGGTAPLWSASNETACHACSSLS